MIYKFKSIFDKKDRAVEFSVIDEEFEIQTETETEYSTVLVKRLCIELFANDEDKRYSVVLNKEDLFKLIGALHLIQKEM